MLVAYRRLFLEPIRQELDLEDALLNDDQVAAARALAAIDATENEGHQSASLGMIYISTTKRLAAWDLITEKKAWEQTYDGNRCDRMAISPDGRTMYVPSFEGPNWYGVDARTGNLIKSLPTSASQGAHNTIWSPDGSKVFMAGLRSNTMTIADAKTHTVARTVGPFANSVRPFTVNGAGTLIYANVNDLLGFQIADVMTGKVIHTVQVQGYGWARERLAGHG